MNIWTNHNWKPMLLKQVEKPFDSKDHIFELKFDGIRAVIFASPKKVIVQSRNKVDISSLFPELQSIKKLVKNDTIFDGEIVAFKDGLPSFSKLQERNHLKNSYKITKESEENPIVFVCFDILYDKKDITNLTLLERKDILKKFKENEYFLKNKFIDTYGKDFFKEIKKKHLEGIIAKRKDSTYKINTRSDVWLKIKNLNIDNFFIGGYIKSNKTNIISLLLGEIRNDSLYYVGKVSLHENNKLYPKILKQKEINNNPFINYKGKGIFIKPNITCNILYLERTKNKHLRQPIYKDI